MQNQINITKIRELLEAMNNAVQEVHGGPDDDLGALVWNTCDAINEELNKLA